MRLSILILAMIVLAGCAKSREAAASAIQAQQASQGVVKIATAPDIAQALATMTPEQRAVVEKALRTIVALANQASDSLAPVVQRLTVDEPAAPIQTTSDMAAAQPEQFIRLAQRQTGRAEAEADQAQQQADYWRLAADYGSAIADSLWSQLLLAGGGTGLIAAAGGIALRARTVIGKLHNAVSDAVEYGTDVAKVAPDDQEALAAVREKHKAKQAANGTRDIIKSKIKAA